MKIEESHFNDASLEALIGKNLVQEPKDLRCKGLKRVSRLCINPNCKLLSLLCGDSECSECNEEAHEECPLIKLKGVTTMLNKKVNSQKEVITKISEIEDKFIEEIRKTNILFDETNHLTGLDE